MKKYIIFQLVFILMFFNKSYSQPAGFTKTATIYYTSTSDFTIHGTATTSLGPINGTGIYFGHGGGALTANMGVGTAALYSNTTGDANTAIGYGSLLVNTTGNYNVAVGVSALAKNTKGFINTAVGRLAMASMDSGWMNVAVGNGSLAANIAGNGNTALGVNALGSGTSGNTNTCIGFNSGTTLTYEDNVGVGSYALGSAVYNRRNVAVGASALGSLGTGADNNVAVGYQALSGISSGNNNVGIGNGAAVTSGTSNQLSIQNVIYGINMTNGSSGNVGIGVVPSATLAKLEVGGTLKINTVNTGTPGSNFLYVDGNGIVNQGPVSGFVTSSCTNQYYVPVVNTNGSTALTCGQIYDNSPSASPASVGIHYTGSFGYTWPASHWYEGSTDPLSSGTLRLAVDGCVQALAYYALSDERYKKDIKNISNALNQIKHLRPVSYNWKEKEFPDKNFNGQPQLGFIAQEVEKVIPEAVIANKDGYYSMNYTTIIPVLTQGIKDQQIQLEKQEIKIANQQTEINELKNKINQLVPGNVIVKDDNFQITPNPVTGTSTVSYKMDASITNAVFIVYDLQGKMLKKYSVDKNTKEGQVQISKKDFGNGMYILSLVSNNQEIQSKHFIIAE